MKLSRQELRIKVFQKLKLQRSLLKLLPMCLCLVQMVIYVEACESGSLFDDILTDTLNIFVTTAADPLESSYACYFDEYRQTYLGDLFSVSWMEDTEKENLLRESLHHQYEAVRHRVNTSHVEEYGNLDIGALHISDFLGFHMNGLPDDIPAVPKVQDYVNNRNAQVALLQKKLEAAQTPKERSAIKFEIHKLLKGRLKGCRNMAVAWGTSLRGRQTELDMT
uniref:Uncharacterized protein n=1 Tax=Timema monikensis TaxID=170555 RepID=A0A7R9E1V2_9NEOP|nr:unnamed protein product [Timema monikensis]